jgi:RimJ/RimL family protein N-acetyltransferase
MTEAPAIETERLRLRGHRVADFADVAAMWAAPEVVRHIMGRPLSGEEAWARLLRHAGHWALLGFGYWAIEEKASGRFVGQAGFADFKREIDIALKDAPEIGWALAPWAHGRGLATEAVRAVVAWGDAHLADKRSWCMVAPEHRASIRVAEKCGYRAVGRADYKGAVLVLARGEGEPGL